MTTNMQVLLRSFACFTALRTHIQPRTGSVFTKARLHTQVTRRAPSLRAVRNDDTIHDIPEEELYMYTRHRWVYNEAYRLSQRYLKFNLEELVQAAATAINDKGFLRCIEVLKCKEGLHNKAFLLTMENGAEIFAKLPHPSAGPSFFTVASEVATREFLREVLGINTPRIIAWSADCNNPVGAEYILEEKAAGKPLGGFWRDWEEWPMQVRASIIEQVVQMELFLASTTFTKSGSIYFREDIPGSEALTMVSPQGALTLGRYTIGPLVEDRLWRGERTSMDLNRGPNNTPREFIEAIAKNERKFITAHASPRINFARSLAELELPQDACELLNRYLKLVPAMVPPKYTIDIHSPTLWHPDLHLNNVFVDPEAKTVKHVIDWQSAAALPFYCQCGVPAMFRHAGPVSDDLNTLSERPPNYKDLDQDDREMIDNTISSEGLHKYYLGITNNRNPRHWAALKLHDPVRTQPSHIVPNVWEESNLFYLRRALIKIADRWEDLYTESGPCPVKFSAEELALHTHEEENMNEVSNILTLFRDKWRLPPDGSVEAANFVEMKAELLRMRDTFIQSAENEEDKVLAEKLWPYQDRPA